MKDRKQAKEVPSAESTNASVPDAKQRPKKRKGLIIAVIALAVLLLLAIILIFALLEDDSEDPVEPTPTNNRSVEPTSVPAGDPVASFDDGNLGIQVETVPDAEIEAAVRTAAEAPHSTEGVTESGVTKEGNIWVTVYEQVFILQGDNVYQVVADKNTKQADNGKVAAAASALVSDVEEYKKGKDDWNHGYGIYFLEGANCLLYYPAQLNFVEAWEDGSVLFRDMRSNAQITVTLEENPFTCMDELESLMAHTEHNRVLASGTDWYSTEEVGKTDTVFCYTGLGNEYMVNVTLRYENRYDFVFGDLRKQISCRFVDSGIWVSNQRADTTGKAVSVVAKEPGIYDPAMNGIWDYLDEWDLYVYRPDILTKAYVSDAGEHIWTDPVTGAYLVVDRLPDSGISSPAELAEYMWPYEAESSGENAVRFWSPDSVGYAMTQNGSLYTAQLFFPEKFDYVYQPALELLKLHTGGEDVSSTEMKDIFFSDYRCCFTVPMQFQKQSRSDGVYEYMDSRTGMWMTITFTDGTDEEGQENIYSLFHVAAEDNAVELGEDYVKWHNSEGLRIGAVGADCTVIMEINGWNAYETYELSWDRFAVRFSDGAEKESAADGIRRDALLQRGDPPEKPESTPLPTMEPQPTAEPEPEEPEVTTENAIMHEYSDYDRLPMADILPEPKEKETITGDLNFMHYDVYDADDVLDILIDAFRDLDYSIEIEPYATGVDYLLTGKVPGTGEVIYMVIEADEVDGVDILYVYDHLRDNGESCMFCGQADLYYDGYDFDDLLSWDALMTDLELMQNCLELTYDYFGDLYWQCSYYIGWMVIYEDEYLDRWGIPDHDELDFWPQLGVSWYDADLDEQTVQAGVVLVDGNVYVSNDYDGVHNRLK